MTAPHRETKDIRPVPCEGARAYRNALCCPAEQANELASIAHRPPPGMVVCKFGSRSVVGRHQLESGADVLLKYYYPKSIVKHLSQALTGSRCLRSWESALRLNALGLPVPSALFVAEWRTFGGLWLDQSMLATAVAPGITLLEWTDLHQHDKPRLESMAERLRGHFKLMAEHRIAHGDLKATNLIVAEDDSVLFVDLDAVSIHLPEAKWAAARERDRRIFLDNWKPGTPAAQAFARTFDS